MVRFENVSKTFPNRKQALYSVNFTIDDGEFVFLVGPSGAGKTTILRLIFRELIPTGGSIFVDALEVNKLKSKEVPYLRRKIGYIFQDFKILHSRTVAENIAVTLEILDKKKEEIDEKVKDILKIINLEDKKDYFPVQLSLGEIQRVAIGRAVVGDADIILADEPTGNLDPKTSWDIVKLLGNINKTGKTIIMATHNIDMVSSMKKRVLAVSGGKLVKTEKIVY
ncbi:cell division ATP-binding protein FtsE [Candidatus Gottesmanbacteria bacterium RIFCSPHIGHO2_01_FULL_39_10]|uniref:Cell division ATP-binding protein FtsE n=1 Tax=Candidatus Gottesmanbacteria bacterium RIFCSPHIGHO2_01_FULL_39_10 TaxID=1798375 RepID=A0A1F5ZRY7_9BACT|nr:MAG: cell division ATP-binding protein FtsE [Candidatus Gottesmanbacteria bacterium RIFCSPHIGHO2_01_FULL_39_10]